MGGRGGVHELSLRQLQSASPAALRQDKKFPSMLMPEGKVKVDLYANGNAYDNLYAKSLTPHKIMYIIYHSHTHTAVPTSGQRQHQPCRHCSSKQSSCSDQ